MGETTLTWISFAAVQIIIITAGAAFLFRLTPGQRVTGRALLLLAAGVALVLVNLIWFWTNGPGGGAAIPMRGGELGAWLSILSGAEIALLGSAALLSARLLRD